MTNHNQILAGMEEWKTFRLFCDIGLKPALPQFLNLAQKQIVI
jgi:hypothetical protein